MLTVISPAKNLDTISSAVKIRASKPDLLGEAEVLATQLRAFSPHEISLLMKVSENLGQLNHDRYQKWKLPFTGKNSRAAILSFNGDVYQGLDVQSFNAEDFSFAQQHLRILSGLYGVLRPLDLMQAYRLEMGTSLKNSRGKDLYAFWGSLITENLNKQIKKVGADHLINLASNEYFKSIKINGLRTPIIEPVFKDWNNGQYKIISFFAKRARGLMSAYIIKNRLTNAEDLTNFDMSGYHFNKAMSSDNKWVFTRKQA